MSNQTRKKVILMSADSDDCDIAVKLTGNFEGIDFNPVKFESLVKYICSCFGTEAMAAAGCEITIVIVTDAEIRKINKSFRGCDSVTDCLSFDLSETDNKASKCFELVVNAEMAVREAENRDHSPEAELALYVTHSLLHNLGFDDSRPEKADKMHNTENKILKHRGFGLVYSQDTEN